MPNNKKTLIKNAHLVNEGEIFKADLLIEGEYISGIYREQNADIFADEVIDAEGQYLIPGVIDDQVHFRDPGLTHKADIPTESKAAVAGGTTSFMEMPNTNPQTITQEALAEKFRYTSDKSLANYSFYMGATNDNLEEILKTDPKTVCGVKVFMGASTGNMLVDNKDSLDKIFEQCPLLIATHCEDEKTIRAATQAAKEKYGDDIPMSEHPRIRSAEACYLSSSYAVGLAKKHGSRLHVLHLTTAKEMELFDNSIPLTEKKITAELCVHHLWFSEEDYERLGAKIKCNPAIKSSKDREALRKALLDNTIDVIATDHAPHLMEEKNNKYPQSPAGLPLVQHSLAMMIEYYKQGGISLERVIEKMCHAPAQCFQVEKRGYLREGYYADLVLLSVNGDNGLSFEPEEVNESNIRYKCKWSPFEGLKLNSKVTHTFVNGHLAYKKGEFDETLPGKRLTFNR